MQKPDGWMPIYKSHWNINILILLRTLNHILVCQTLIIIIKLAVGSWNIGLTQFASIQGRAKSPLRRRAKY